MKKKFVVLILSLLFINTIFAQSGLDLPFTSSKSGFTDSKTMLLKGPIKLFKEDIYNAKLIKNTIVKGKLLCTVIKEFDESGRIVLESVSEDFLNMYIKFFVIYNYLDSSDYNNKNKQVYEKKIYTFSREDLKHKTKSQTYYNWVLDNGTLFSKCVYFNKQDTDKVEVSDLISKSADISIENENVKFISVVLNIFDKNKNCKEIRVYNYNGEMESRVLQEFDALNRIRRRMEYNSFGGVTNTIDYMYDNCGNMHYITKEDNPNAFIEVNNYALITDNYYDSKTNLKVKAIYSIIDKRKANAREELTSELTNEYDEYNNLISSNCKTFATGKIVPMYGAFSYVYKDFDTHKNPVIYLTYSLRNNHLKTIIEREIEYY